MDRKTYCYKLADINERLYEIDNSLKELSFSIFLWRDNPEKQEWYLQSQARLIEEKNELEEEKETLMQQYSYLLDEED